MQKIVVYHDAQKGRTLYDDLEATLIQPLTDTEKRVLILVGAGLSNQDIADRRHITLRTVESHLTSIYAKLQATGRANACIRAWWYGELEPYQWAQCMRYEPKTNGDGNGT